MIVMKFGGSSVKDAEAVDRVSGIIASRLDERPVVVVSAMGDTTDELAGVLEALELGRDEHAKAIAGAIAKRHLEIIDAVLSGDAREAARADISIHLAALDRRIAGMASLEEVSPRSRDAVLSVGELMSAALLARFAQARGLPATAVDPRRIIATDDRHCDARPDPALTEEACREVLAPMAAAGRIPVTGGFVGASREGRTTTLGRGGSDLSASLVAGALEAARLEFWKDVDGILTADPRIVPEARPVSRLTFAEAAELALLGAAVLHPASIQPALAAGVPVRVLNSYRADAPGTEIRCEGAQERRDGDPAAAAKAIAFKRDQVLVNVHSNRMLGASGFLRRVFEVFDRLELSVDHIATSEVNVTVTMAATPAIGRLVDELSAIASATVRRDIGVVSVVGERLNETAGVASRIFGALRGVNVRLVTYGGSGVNLSMAVDDADVPEAVTRLHDELFFERRPAPRTGAPARGPGRDGRGVSA